MKKNDVMYVIWKSLPPASLNFFHSMPLEWVQVTRSQAQGSLLLELPHSSHVKDIYKETNSINIAGKSLREERNMNFWLYDKNWVSKRT